MNINNFEDYFDCIILKRGLDYYKSGNIVSLECDTDDNVWTAEVSGNDDYTVTVMLSAKNEITETDCDCPYDMNVHCKHQASVFYAIRDELQKKTKSKPKSKSAIKNLEGLDKQVILSLLLEFAKKDKRIKEEILLRYAYKSDILESAQKLIRSTIKAVTR
ncbi:MAG: hypothetical protein FWF94_02960 [Oscillospiraceae bacterium]|nr:hypothetical protein [Oscillospiraceae bacterium]